MILNRASKVYGPSIKKFYEAGSDLGLMNLGTFVFYGFFERYKEVEIKTRGYLES
jgi:hypothetical protein